MNENFNWKGLIGLNPLQTLLCSFLVKRIHTCGDTWDTLHVSAIFVPGTRSWWHDDDDDDGDGDGGSGGFSDVQAGFDKSVQVWQLIISMPH